MSADSNLGQFAFEAMGGDGLSVSRNESTVVVTCDDHDGRDTIALTRVFALAKEHGVQVVDGEAHFDSEEVALVVAEKGWSRGDDS